MDIHISDIVCARAGRDKGKYFFVVGTEEEYVLLADGKGRRLERPKRKKLRHVDFALRIDGRTAQKLRCGDKVSNSELRRALADVPTGLTENKEE